MNSNIFRKFHAIGILISRINKTIKQYWRKRIQIFLLFPMHQQFHQLNPPHKSGNNTIIKKIRCIKHKLNKTFKQEIAVNKFKTINIKNSGKLIRLKKWNMPRSKNWIITKRISSNIIVIYVKSRSKVMTITEKIHFSSKIRTNYLKKVTRNKKLKEFIQLKDQIR